MNRLNRTLGAPHRAVNQSLDDSAFFVVRRATVAAKTISR